MYQACRLAIFVLIFVTPMLRAGLHYSGEIANPLPSRWQGFIMDHRTLRNVARKPTERLAASPLRKRYEDEAAKLEKAAKVKALSANEIADLGALYVRLGNLDRAIAILRPAQRDHPKHFAIHANLATAWQLQGQLAQAIASLQQGLRYVPREWKEAEQLHLKLLQLRKQEAPGSQALDNLFSISFETMEGAYEPGKIPEAAKKKLPKNAIALTQQLALWLPSDGRLLWQLAELAAAHGSIRTAAAMMDGCVTEFGLRERALRVHRRKMRSLVDAILKSGPGTKAEHSKHALQFKPASSRPLANRFFRTVLPPINPNGINPLLWEVITQTSVDRHYRPTFPKYLEKLHEKEISIQGYIQPLGKHLEMTSFLLIEYPVGCWYCEIPEIIAMIYVELPLEKSLTFTRKPVQITGKLKLNATDPEDFLYTIQNAKATVQE